ALGQREPRQLQSGRRGPNRNIAFDLVPPVKHLPAEFLVRSCPLHFVEHVLVVIFYRLNHASEFAHRLPFFSSRQRASTNHIIDRPQRRGAVSPPSRSISARARFVQAVARFRSSPSWRGRGRSCSPPQRPPGRASRFFATADAHRNRDSSPERSDRRV